MKTFGSSEKRRSDRVGALGSTTSTQHPQLARLPEWPSRSIAILVTVGQGPFAIPISAPQRRGDREILFALRRSRGSLARLSEFSRVALVLLCEGNVAFTARGAARVVEAPMRGAPDYAAVVLDVEQIDDHRQPEFLVEFGVGRSWVDEEEKQFLGARVAALLEMVVGELPSCPAPARA
jgi:hypothetical protein